MNSSIDLSSLKIAILAANGFSERDMSVTQKTLNAAGANVRVISVDQNLIMGWADGDWGHHYAVDYTLSRVLAADYDAVVVPSGTRSLDKLQLTQHTKRIISGFVESDKPSIFIAEAKRLLDFSQVDTTTQSILVVDENIESNEELAVQIVDHLAAHVNQDVLAA